MASSKEYLEFILEQLPGSNDTSYRAMMGEFIIYYRGKVVGGIYDDRFLVKPTKSALTMIPNADMEVPYEGAKEMILFVLLIPLIMWKFSGEVHPTAVRLICLGVFAAYFAIMMIQVIGK